MRPRLALAPLSVCRAPGKERPLFVSLEVADSVASSPNGCQCALKTPKGQRSNIVAVLALGVRNGGVHKVLGSHKLQFDLEKASILHFPPPPRRERRATTNEMSHFQNLKVRPRPGR